MAIRHEVQVRIDRPASAVFAALADVERWPEWLIASGIRHVTLVDGPPLRVGTRLHIDQSAAGRAATIEATVTKLEPDARFAVDGRDQQGATTDIEARLTADGAATALAWRVEIRLPLMLRAFEGLASPQVRRAIELDLEAFRRRLLSVPTD
jgi:uncharacterized protein YndB with AHSA1/START domain